MKILPNENIIISSNENKVVLTTQRIHMTDTVWGNSYNISIFLEDISSIESKYTSQIIFIVLAVASVIVGAATSSHGSESLIGGFIVGAIFLGLWAYSRRHIISISSDGGAALNFIVTGMSVEAVSDFIYNVSLAKAAKIEKLYKER